MLSSNFKSHIGQVLGSSIKNVEPVSGGDISTAFCVYTPTERFFCKVNDSARALDMFFAEKAGLEYIGQTKTIKVPQILGCGQFNGNSFLLMEFVEPKGPDQKDMDTFGHQLAEMHSYVAGESFGWKRDNFIGSLPQSNKNHPDWATFYVYERLLPQLTMAKQNNLLAIGEIPSENELFKGCQRFFPKVKPALLHGDLWNGNYLISSEGIPYLIDPSVYFGHSEVDLAMTKLFGGFGTTFYSAYDEHFPVHPHERELTEIYHLYYLLVHLNLFGRSYYQSVRQLLKTYFVF